MGREKNGRDRAEARQNAELNTNFPFKSNYWTWPRFRGNVPLIRIFPENKHDWYLRHNPTGQHLWVEISGEYSVAPSRLDAEVPSGRSFPVEASGDHFRFPDDATSQLDVVHVRLRQHLVAAFEFRTDCADNNRQRQTHWQTIECYTGDDKDRQSRRFSASSNFYSAIQCKQQSKCFAQMILRSILAEHPKLISA